MVIIEFFKNNATYRCVLWAVLALIFDLLYLERMKNKALADKIRNTIPFLLFWLEIFINKVIL